MKYFSIAIDGPAGAGKSTIAKIIAKKLSFIYVDTGAMYRAMALYFIRNNIMADDKDKIEEACNLVDISIEYMDGEQQIILNGENVTGLIRTEEVGNMASACSVYSKVRLKLVELQRSLAEKSNVVMDGRDIGTYVLPNANLKIYLTASSKERAKRRYLELINKGISADIDNIEKDIIDRDNRDMNREFAPLKQAEDAIVIDSSNMTIDEVADSIIKYYEKSVK
ncbi:(d)CMP kinase [Herbinix luporum]|jgi:cytidylate kinase|uniref:Cytidylate kinase n=1 Tax=Herbinix luporum TaxID=1679721 RepID=A0A0K8J5B1_9FIRM|nr:(d)CMP kinase [Herbinix luporum]MDI9489197.1 (d)CMP kinase [Bacillota bacterium]CUH92645.1 Cytidylate kinase [Herbinix luporum]HHT56717.1 (d)CMP kinase [Herbinix luporum]